MENRGVRRVGAVDRFAESSFGLSLVGLLFMATPILSLGAVVFAMLSVRASRMTGTPPSWLALTGFVGGILECLLAAWFYTAVLTGQVPFH